MQIAGIGRQQGVITVVIFFLMNLSLAGCLSEKQNEQRYEGPYILQREPTIGEIHFPNRVYPVDPYSADNDLYLFEVASKGDLEMVKLLCIRHSANVNAEVFYSYALAKYTLMTPLMEAAANGHLKIVKFLLDNGAEINKRFSDAGLYRTAISLAYSRGKLDVYKYLQSKGAIEEWNDLDNNSEIPASHSPSKNSKFLVPYR